ncbi:MAG: hypothetical protein ABFD82_00595 [Syntrophaceae bacterium]
MQHVMSVVKPTILLWYFQLQVPCGFDTKLERATLAKNIPASSACGTKGTRF